MGDSTKRKTSSSNDATIDPVEDKSSDRSRTIGKDPAPGKAKKASAKEKPVETQPVSGDTKTIKELTSSCKELEEKYLRLRAEYDNHIKRTSKEKHELITYAGSQVFRLILPILDDLRRIVDHANEDESNADDPVIQGVELIIEKFTKLLETEGVKVFHAVGEEFDPEFHEALMTRSSNEHPVGTVLEEFEPGYKYRDRVLRHAKVVVSG